MSRLETLLEMAREEEPDAFTSYAIGMEYVKTEDFDNAFQWFDKALEHDSEYTAAYYQYGLAKAAANDLDAAEDLLRKGLEIAEAKGDMHTQEEIEAALDAL